MEALIKIITEKTGISENQAATAVYTVVNYLKDKMPAGIGNQIESYLGSGSATTGSTTENIKDKIGEFFGK